MSISKNIRRFRKDNGISQEHIAEKLHMSQPTYYRLEQRDAACTKRLAQIADALNTTPELLLTYHQTITSDSIDSLRNELDEKETQIQAQQQEITFLKHYTDYLRVFWNKYVRRNTTDLNEG